MTTILNEVKEEFFYDRGWNSMYFIERKPFMENLANPEKGFRLTFNKATNEGRFYKVVADFLVDYDVLDESKTFNSPEECWTYFENKVKEMIKE